MKKIILLMLTSILFFTACNPTNEDAQKSSYSNPTIMGLIEANQKLLAQYSTEAEPTTRAKGRKGLTQLEFTYITMHDYLGAASGIGAVHNVALGLGFATGGTGYFTTCGICGAFCAAGSSWKAYRDLRGYTSKLKTPSEGPLFITAQNAFLEAYDSIKINKPNETAYKDLISKINLPSKYSYLKDVGENHNGILTLTLSNTSDFSTRSVGLGGPNGGPITGGIIPPAKPGTWLPNNTNSFKSIETIVKSDELKNTYNEEMSKDITEDYNRFIDDNFNSNNVKEALKLYSTVYQNFPTNNDGIIAAVNEYIDTIERHNDFNSEEKEIIYGALIVSLYSPQLWKEIEKY